MTNVTPDSVHVPWISQWWIKLSCLVIATFSFATLYIMTSRASLPLPFRLRQFKCCNMSPTLDVFRCQLMKNIKTLRWTISRLLISPLLWGSQEEQANSSHDVTKDLWQWYVCCYNDSSRWPWRVLLNVIGFFFRVTDRRHIRLKSHFQFCFPYCNLVEIWLTFCGSI